MKVLSVNPKGGSAKTTLVTNVAVLLAKQKRDVLLLDTDGLATARQWCERRNEMHPELPTVNVAQGSGNVMKMIHDLASRYTDVLIDTGSAFDSTEMRSAAVAADILLIPVFPSIFDLESLDIAASLVAQSRIYNPGLKALVVLSRAPTNIHNAELRNAKAFVEKYAEFELCPHVAYDRKAWRDAALEGLSVAEGPNPSAKAEAQLITDYILKM